MNLPRLKNKKEREIAKGEADRETKLTQQLGAEKQRAAILREENEIQKLNLKLLKNAKFLRKLSKFWC